MESINQKLIKSDSVYDPSATIFSHENNAQSKKNGESSQLKQGLGLPSVMT
jgi:hypothetical protein